MGAKQRGRTCLVLALLLSVPFAWGAEEGMVTGNGGLAGPRQLLAEAEELPPGWRSEARTVRVKAPGSAEPEPRDITYYANGLGMEFVLIRPGEFVMGSARGESGREDSEGPQRPVRITRAFYLGAYEVTQQQYARVMGRNPSKFVGEKNPVEQVSWDDAVEFCARLSANDGCTYRLPTEAEWEYACRSASTTTYCYGDDPEQLGDHAWFRSNSGEKTHEVGLKQANAWGLHDVLGNVWEWCQDWYGNYERGPAEDPTGATSGIYRVLRGGSWFDYPTPFRSASRGRCPPTVRSDNCGFRVVCVPTT